MTPNLFLVLILKYYILCTVKSAPSRVNGQAETAAFPSHTVQELGAVNDRQLVNSSSNNGSKISSGGKNSGSNELPGTYDIDRKMTDTSEVTKVEDVNIPAASGVKKEGSKSNVMALSDDVITDALFANIDTLQDHLEVCEEGLRQQLRLRSHGKLLEDFVAEEADYKPGKNGLKPAGEDKKENADVKTDNEDDTEEDDDEEYENDDGTEEETGEKVNDKTDGDDVSNGEKETHSPNLLSSSGKPEQHPRRPRSVPGASQDGLTLHKADALAQKVVSRLSDRLDYLRMSLVQCHLLYRQFELL